MKRIIPILVLGTFLGMTFMPKSPSEVRADPVATNYNFSEYCDLVHARFPLNEETTFGNELGAFGTNWGEYSSMPDIKSMDATYARMVLNAPDAGTYSLKLFYNSGEYDIKVYVNSYDNPDSFILPDNGWAGGSHEIEVQLNQGKNVVLLQVNKWGQMKYFQISGGVEVINHHSTVSGTYTPSDMVYQAAYLDSTVNVFDPDAIVTYQPLAVNSNDSYEGAAILHFTPQSDTKSLDLKLVTSGETKMDLSLGTYANTKTITLPNYLISTSYTYHISDATLSELDFDTSTKQVLRISSNSGQVKVDSVTESTVLGEVDPIVDETDEKIITGVDLIDAVKINGRSIIADGSICLDWSNSGVEFMVTGTGDLVGDFTLESDTQNTRFAVEIDGFPAYYIKPNGRTNIATGISGTHKIGLFKTSEAAGNLCKLNALIVDKSTVVSKPTDVRPFKFEIVGDSITCANQIEQNVEDAYWGYANLLAHRWNADLNTISCSGRGLAQGFNSEEGWPASTQHQMKDIYDQVSYFRESTLNWDASKYTPDVVVVNLGSNDLGNYILTCAGCSLENFLTSVTSFSNKLTGLYPNAKIVWAYGSFVNRKYITEYRNTVEALNNPNIGFVELPQMMHGDSGHPNDLNHDTIAKLISNKIAEMLNVTDPYTPRFDYQTLEAEDGTLKGGTIHTINRDTDADIYWSGRGYVGDMNFDDKNPDYPTSISEIKPDLSNISYIKLKFNAPKDANYTVRIGFATSVTAKFAIRANTGAWQEVTASGTDWCGGHGLFVPVTLPMSQGENEITVTSALNAGGWINYDFFDVITGDSITMHTISCSGEHITFNGVPSKVEDGGSFSFTVKVDDLYSKSSIDVKLNGETITPTNGLYSVTNVTSDVAITVTGVSINTWTVHYLVDDTTEFATRTVAVGGSIPTNVGTPTKEGYTFKGWDIQFTQMPNSDINVQAIWEKNGSNPDKPGETNVGLVVGLSVGGATVAAGGAVTATVLIKKRKIKK